MKSVPTPVRPPPVSNVRVIKVVRRLTARDRFLCHVLYDHQVLLTAQVTDLCFGNVITAQHRLSTLVGLRVLDRFRHFRQQGSEPYHYVLDAMGVEIVAADRGIEVSRAEARRLRSLALTDSQRLAHLIGVNGLFCQVARSARRDRDVTLSEWWSERRCANGWGAVVRPDGFGTLVGPKGRVEFLVEVDRGTEPLKRLAEKLTGYADLVRATGWSPWVCFAFPSPRREAEARRVLDHPSLRIATTVEGIGDGAGGQTWLLIGSTGPRRRLIDLPVETGTKS